MAVYVCFLDIDGTLNNPASLLKDNGPDPKCISALNWLIKQSGAKIVVSSSWRGRNDLPEIFKKWGIEAPILSRTPYLPRDWYPSDDKNKTDRAHRGYEIQQWLNQTPYRIKQFCILDDDNDMGPFLNYLVQCNYLIGLTMDDAKRALAILGE